MVSLPAKLAAGRTVVMMVMAAIIMVIVMVMAVFVFVFVVIMVMVAVLTVMMVGVAVVIVMVMVMAVVVLVAVGRAAVQVVGFLRRADLVSVPGHREAVFAEIAAHHHRVGQQFVDPLLGYIDNQIMHAQIGGGQGGQAQFGFGLAGDLQNILIDLAGEENEGSDHQLFGPQLGAAAQASGHFGPGHGLKGEFHRQVGARVLQQVGGAGNLGVTAGSLLPRPMTRTIDSSGGGRRGWRQKPPAPANPAGRLIWRAAPAGRCF